MPLSLRVRRSWTSATPEPSAATVPPSWRGPLPLANLLPSAIAVIFALGAVLSDVPQKPSWPLVTHGAAALGAAVVVEPVADAVVPQKPSCPLVAQPAIRAGARLSLRRDQGVGTARAP